MAVTDWGWLLTGEPPDELRPMQHFVRMINTLLVETYESLTCQRLLKCMQCRILRVAVVLELLSIQRRKCRSVQLDIMHI